MCADAQKTHLCCAQETAAGDQPRPHRKHNDTGCATPAQALAAKLVPFNDVVPGFCAPGDGLATFTAMAAQRQAARSAATGTPAAPGGVAPSAAALPLHFLLHFLQMRIEARTF